MNQYAGSPQQIFFFDQETEKKTGALTMFIFSVCLYVSPIILASASVMLSLGTYLLSYYTSIPIASGAVTDQDDLIFACASIALFMGFVFLFTFGLAAFKQLLQAYALLEDGRLIKVKWKLRQTHPIQAHLLARKIAKHTSMSRAGAHQAISGLHSLWDGLDHMHNPLILAGHLNGSAVRENMINIPLSNIRILKKTKKKLVILADTLVKNKPKRKKMTIYWMYYDMDTLCRLCEGGYPVVNQ